MKQKHVIIFSFWMMVNICHAQSIYNKHFEFGVNVGYASSLISDTKLNNTEYTGTNGTPVQFIGSYLGYNYLYNLKVTAIHQRYSPDEAYLELYEYNLIKSRYYNLDFNVYRNIKLSNRKWWLGLGLNFQSNYSLNRLYFNSLIFEGNTNFRKSYSFTLGSLGPSVIIQYQPNKHHQLTFNASYRRLGLVLRPDDNYVKQISHVEGGSNLYWLAGKNFQAGLLNATYTYHINSRIGFVLIWETYFEKIQSDDEFKLGNNQVLMGINIRIW